MSVVAFLGSTFLISFLTSATDTFEKLNIKVLLKSFIAIGLGCFAYFNMALKIGWKILSAQGTVPWKSGNFRSLTALEKNVKNFCNFYIIINSFIVNVTIRIKSFCSTNVIFSEDLILSESKGFTVRQNCLLSLWSFSFKFA